MITAEERNDSLYLFEEGKFLGAFLPTGEFVREPTDPNSAKIYPQQLKVLVEIGFKLQSGITFNDLLQSL